MKHIALGVQDLIVKVRQARVDVESLEELRKIGVPEDGASFMIQRVLYIFIADDKTDDDGLSSIRSESIPAFKPGRFRRGALAVRQKA